MTRDADTAVRLLGPAEVRQIAARLGIRPSKRLGQNFVIDQGTIRRIVGLARLRPDDVVLEVGPGIGSLTLGLIDAVKRVVAVEVDPVLAAELPATVADRATALADRLTVVTADALTLQSGAAGRSAGTAQLAIPDPQPTALVANLPYNVAVPVVLHLLEELPSIDRALVMVQAEVADRMAAEPGSRTYGVPSVKVAWYGTARRAGAVSRTVFWPAPNVDSALVAFTRWPEGSGPGQAAGEARVTREEVFAVIDAAFAQRRKTLRSALASWAGSPGAAEKILREAGVEPALRGEAIGIERYIRIVLAARKARTIIES
ncbi:MAG: 16S rRNA (adenine(1518)-N(6)/adenine(1519)-N(6))-dimethyltransferase RsmA [Nocardiopsaceae bacterium]|nr:16S rRNA (adenine(1518)-N(6)/adenine(1519)-N(6))-dimethyltransferase RsmA [Nocardiopsaceae bacterium]